MDATGRNDDAGGRNATAGRTPRFWISLALLSGVIFVYVLLMTNRTRDPTGTSGPAIGRSLGYLEFQPLTSSASAVGLADLARHVTLINFWGTWCPPCIRELPEIVAIGDRFAEQSEFRLYAVSCGEMDDPDLDSLRQETETFLQAREINLLIYADQHAATRRAMTILLGVPMAYPTTLVLDRTGKIRGYWQGYDVRAADDMSRLIEQLLAEPQ